MIEVKGKYTSAMVTIDDVESTCISQINEFVNHPAFTNPIAIMCDCHTGKGSVIGFTMPMTEKVIPNVIGVDISCGMLLTVIKDLFKDITKEELEAQIRRSVPFGINTHNSPQISLDKHNPKLLKWDWKAINDAARQFAYKYTEVFGKNILTKAPDYNYAWFEAKCKEIGISLDRAINSIGSLGGGNHFIEVGQIDEERFTITVHSGSRNFGKMICEYWQNKACKKNRGADVQELVKNAKTQEEKRALSAQIKKLKSKELKFSDDLMYLEGDDALGYLYDMIFVNYYAHMNRKVMMNLILEQLKRKGEVIIEETIESTHNYIDFEDMVIRKGAIKSYTGSKMVIPFNMRDGLLICEGKSNPEWNYSAPHGAGRVLSRRAAKEQLSLEEFKKDMEGIYSTSICFETLDESKQAYKSATMIEQAIEPTAKILYKSRVIINLKSIK